MPSTRVAPAGERFYMLVVYVWVSMLQSLTWPPIAAAPDAAKHEFPGMTDAMIMLQLNWGPIVQMAFIPAAMALLSGRSGLQRCVRAGVVLAALAAAFRVLAVQLPAAARATTGARWLLHVAGMLCGASASFLQGTPTRFSAVWFPPEQRARATGCAFVGLGLGQALCYALSPVLVRSLDELGNSLLFQLAVAAPPLVCCLVHFPDAPCSAGDRRDWSADTAVDGGAGTLVVPLGAVGGTESASVHEAPKPWWRPLLIAMRKPSALLLATLCSLANGPYQGWGAALPTIWKHLHYKNSQADLLSLASMVAYTFGCYVVGELGDRVFRGRLKMLLGLLLAGAFGSFLWLCMMLPSNFRDEPLIDIGFSSIFVAVFLTGAFVGATNPISMEFLAEVTHPAQEGVSGNFVIFLTQVFTVIVLAGVPYLDPLATTPVMALIILLCGLLLLPVKSQYLRSVAEGSL